MIHCIKRGCIRILFWAIIIIALSISGLRYALSDLEFYKANIEAHLSEELGAPVTIERIQGVLNGIKPVLSLQNVQLHSELDNKPTVQLQEIYLGINLLAAINYPWLEAMQISIMGAKLSITRLASGRISIEGLPNSDTAEQPDWLMRGNQYKLIDSDILWHDKKRNAEPVQLKQVNISLLNSHKQHQIFFNTDLPPTLGQSLQFAMEFTGNILVPDSINARIFIQATEIQLDKLVTGDLPFDFSFTQGKANISLWSQWQDAKMTQMSGSVALSNALITDSKKTQYSIDQLELQLKLQKHQQQWHLALQDSLISANKTTVEVAQLALALEFDEQDNLIELAVNCPQLTLGSVSKIIQHYKILPPPLHQQLQTLAIEGKILDLFIFANPSKQAYTFNGQLQQISTKPLEQIPGISGLSVYFQGSEQSGFIQLNPQHLNISAPQLFGKPIHLNHVAGKLHWQHTDKWVLSSSLLELNTPHFATTSKLTFSLPHATQPAFINLQSSFNIPDIAQIPQYVPADSIDEETRSWLDQAFLGGSVKQGGLIIRGTPDKFPFAYHKGVFEVLFAAQGVDFHYDPEWQDILDLAGEIHFVADSMAINIHQGRVNRSSIKQAKVTLDSLESSTFIHVQGIVKSEISDALLFLKNSPLKEQSTEINKNFAFNGSTDIDIDLKIPFSDQPIKANIRAKTQNTRATFIPIDLALTNINADFLITENGVFSKRLSATALGFPISAAITLSDQAKSATIFGKMSIQRLAEQFPNPLWAHLKGTSKYHLQLELPQQIAQNYTLQINSDLVGIEVSFAPFAKPEALAHPFFLKLGLNSDGIDAINLRYENRLKPSNRIDITLQKIAPNWQGLVHTPIASGSVILPMELSNNTEISLSLKHLNLSAFKDFDFNPNDTKSIVIQNLPNIQLESQTLYWNDHNLGNLIFNTQTTDKGITIKQCSISSETNSLSLTGFWHQDKQDHTSAISGLLMSQNFGELLQQNLISNDIKGATAEINYSLSWPAKPYELTGAILSGTMDAQLTNGRILGVDPGLGRILGALDIWKLGKRLRFDFSDITEKGLSFAETTARFKLDKGFVTTKDLNINAMPATIEVTGSTHLATEQINLRATVLPKFPIAGTIIGNVANAVSKSIIGNEHAGGLIASMQYQIDGTWEDFKINRLYNSVLPDIISDTP